MEIKNRYRKPSTVKALERLAFQRKKEDHPDFPYPVPPKYRDDSTNALTTCVIDWIRLNGGQAERINSTGRQVTIGGRSKWIKGSGTTGTADISATIRGRAVKIEIKCEATGDKYQSKAQKEYQASIENAGGIYIIVRNFTEFWDWFNDFSDGR